MGTGSSCHFPARFWFNRATPPDCRYAASVVHCMMVSLAQGGEGMETVWGEQRAREYLHKAGSSQVAMHHLEGDPMHAFYVARI